MDNLAITPEELAKLRGNEPVEEPAARPAKFAPLQPVETVTSSTNLDMLMGVTLRIAVELGRTKMTIQEVLGLGPGSVVELDKVAGEPVDIMVNDRLIARGEVVVIEDHFGVRVTDVLSPAKRIESLA
jgi:flagellar motor switch protein FliN